MKKMLINATQKEEVRIALVEDNVLLDLDIEQRKNDNKKSNIYNGVVTRIEPSLEACFVNYGEGRDGFLPFKDIHPSFVDGTTGAQVKEKLKPGQKLIVQVSREERGNKGAALTTYIAIASTYLVLMPNSPDVEGISRRLPPDERDKLRSKLDVIGAREGEGIIVRTAGVGCSAEELRYDLDILHFVWDSIQKYASENPEVGILHHESESIIRVIRDYLTKDIHEIVTDNADAYHKAEHYLRLVRPQTKPKLTLHVGNDPLFSHYHIEEQIDTAFQRTVKLKSGGAIVIDTTEALTAIDVNSSRYTSGTDIETTALNTNLEAADEIARQLKIRDLGGLIVIDFIDMTNKSSQGKVEERMRKATADDRARIQMQKISKFGLMEVSRQRIRGSIAESTNHVCPRCSGTGFIRDNESIALHILRQAAEEAGGKGIKSAYRLNILVPNEIAAYLLNEKREQVLDLEKQHRVQIVIVPQADLLTPHFSIHKVRKGDHNKDTLSYDLPKFYAEQERNSARNKSSRTSDRSPLTSEVSGSGADEHKDKTFEGRLEHADFIKEALEREEQKQTLFGRFKLWLKGLFTSDKKDEEVEVEEIKKTKTSRRRNSKKRNQADVKQVVTATADAELTASQKAELKAARREERKQRNLERQAAQAQALQKEEVNIDSFEKIDSGGAIDIVIGGKRERRLSRKARKAAEAAAAAVATPAVTVNEEPVVEPTEAKPAILISPEYDYENLNENIEKGGVARSRKSERAERRAAERAERAEKAALAAQTEKAEKAEKPEKVERADKVEKLEKQDKSVEAEVKTEEVETKGSKTKDLLNNHKVEHLVLQDEKDIIEAERFKDWSVKEVAQSDNEFDFVEEEEFVSAPKLKTIIDGNEVTVNTPNRKAEYVNLSRLHARREASIGTLNSPDFDKQLAESKGKSSKPKAEKSVPADEPVPALTKEQLVAENPHLEEVFAATNEAMAAVGLSHDENDFSGLIEPTTPSTEVGTEVETVELETTESDTNTEKVAEVAVVSAAEENLPLTAEQKFTNELEKQYKQYAELTSIYRRTESSMSELAEMITEVEKLSNYSFVYLALHTALLTLKQNIATIVDFGHKLTRVTNQAELEVFSTEFNAYAREFRGTASECNLIRSFSNVIRSYVNLERDLSDQKLNQRRKDQIRRAMKVVLDLMKHEGKGYIIATKIMRRFFNLSQFESSPAADRIKKLKERATKELVVNRVLTGSLTNPIYGNSHVSEFLIKGDVYNKLKADFNKVVVDTVNTAGK